MDDGYIIPNLGEPWAFMGVRIFEWATGLSVGFIFQEMFLGNLAASMPIFCAIIFGTALSLAQLRKQYPDEERGLMCSIIASMGFNPPFIPPPASLQPLWSAAPMREMEEKKEFMQLGLLEVPFGKPLDEDPNAKYTI